MRHHVSMARLLATLIAMLVLVGPAEAWDDQIVHIDTFAAGDAEGVVPGDTLAIDGDGIDGFPRRGTWTSDVFKTSPATEFLPSWAVDAPADTGVRFSVRVKVDGEWSPWLDFGYWGDVPPPTDAEAFDGGTVAVDILELDKPAEAWQTRADLFAYDLHATPVVRRISMAVRGPSQGEDGFGEAEWSGEIEVPFLAQASGGGLIGGEICSPTSIAMAVGAFGIDVDVAANALAVYDREHGIFGNWNRAVARANALGADAHLERFDNWLAVAEHLKAGRVIVASINYDAGEAPSFVIDATAGHLIVIKGLTDQGDAIVNDGASASEGEGAVYVKEELEQAWFQNAGGVGYVVGPGRSKR